MTASELPEPTEVERMMAMHAEDTRLATPSDRPPMEMALDSLDRSQSALSEMIEMLSQRLAPVLRQPEEKAVPGGSDVRGAIAVVVDRVYGAQNQAEYQAMRIRDLMDRLVV